MHYFCEDSRFGTPNSLSGNIGRYILGLNCYNKQIFSVDSTLHDPYVRNISACITYKNGGYRLGIGFALLKFSDIYLLNIKCLRIFKKKFYVE